MKRLLVLVAAFAAGACGAHHHPPGTASAAPADVTLLVTNHNFLDITVFLLRDGQRIRIGLATGTSNQSFTIPGRLIAQSPEIVLLGDAIGSNDVARTETLIVHPGQRIEWTLETDLRRSSVGVY